MKSTILTAALMFLFVCSACAESKIEIKTGNDVLRVCQLTIRMWDGDKSMTVEDDFEAMFCIGYIRGINDTQAVWTGTDKAMSTKSAIYKHCLGENVTISQTVRVLVKWLRDNPLWLDKPGAITVLESMSQSFPCNK